MAEEKPEDEWRHESSERNDNRLRAGAPNAARIRLETHFEQQQYNADLSEEPYDFGRFHPTQNAGSEANAGQYLPYDCRNI
jgi:hypothetical protein